MAPRISLISLMSDGSLPILHTEGPTIFFTGVIKRVDTKSIILISEDRKMALQLPRGMFGGAKNLKAGKTLKIEIAKASLYRRPGFTPLPPQDGSKLDESAPTG